ncbi:MAG TPA: TIGR04211 family SH3 domain-containing protein [Gammaproteobacteria bacterium]
MARHTLSLLLLLGLAAAAGAETVYVTDILRLGLHRAQDTSDAPFESLVSGTPLEVLERVPSYARVRTPDGREGWVKSMFLVTEKPAQARVAELEAEVAKLEDAVAKAEAARTAAEREAARLAKEAASGTDSVEALRATVERLERDNRAFEERLETYRGAVPLSWAAAALLVTLAGGFVGGWWWLDASIRRRHGGFRVY